MIRPARPRGRRAAWLACLLAMPMALAAETPAPLDVAPAVTAAASAIETTDATPPADAAPTTRSGLDIHRRFRENLAEADCRNASPRWRAHYARAPVRMARQDDELMSLFGYVVDEFIKAGLPTEYALVPFIESRYTPSARSAAGPAGLWQFIALTARNQGITMRPGYDGRYSVVESTRAAVRYFKILHSMFGGNWRLAIMGYNAGEYRIIGAIRRSGQSQRNADPGKLQGVPALTQAYVEKLHAISCLIEEADNREEWLRAVDRPVPFLVAEPMTDAAPSLAQWAKTRALDGALLARLNPAHASGPLRAGAGHHLLVPAGAAAATAVAERPAPVGALPSVLASGSAAAALAGDGDGQSRPSTHTVQRGDSFWTIARRYKLSTAELLRRNGLKPGATLRPGMVLKLD